MRRLQAIAFALVWLFPLPAGLYSIVHPELLSMDSGGKGVFARAILQSLILFASVLLLLVPTSWGRWERGFRWSLLGLLAAWGAAAVLSSAPADSAWVWVELLTSCLFLLLCRQLGSSPRLFLVGLRGAVLTAFTVCLVALLLHASQADARAAVVGTFYQADVAAGYVLLLVPVAVSLFVGYLVLGLRPPASFAAGAVACGVAAVVLGTTLLLTYSRGGLLATVGVLAVAVPAWIAGARRLVGCPSATWWKIAGCVAVLCLACVIFAGVLSSPSGISLFPQKVAERALEFRAQEDTSVSARLYFWKGAVRMALDRPLLGWGPDCFGRIFPRYQSDVRFYSKYTHSQPLTFLAEGGFITLVAFAVFLCCCAAGLVRSVRDSFRQALSAQGDGQSEAILRFCVLLGVVCGLCAGLLHIVVDVDWEFSAVRVTWFGLLGLGLGAGLGEREPEADGRVVRQWALCLPLLALMAVQPLPWLAAVAERSAEVSSNQGNLQESVASLLEATRRMPWTSLYRRELAENLLLMADRRPGEGGRPWARQAVEQALCAVRFDPERAVNHDVLARAYVACDDLQAAQREMQAAIARDPVNYPGFYNVLAQIQVRQGRLEEARRTLGIPVAQYAQAGFSRMWPFRRTSLYRQLQHTYTSLGRLAQDQNQPVDARRWYEKAVEIAPENTFSRFQLGMLLMGEGLPGDAYVHFSAIARMKPSHPISMWLLGLCYRELGQEVMATTMLADACKRMPALSHVGEPGAPPLRIPDDFFSTGPSLPESSMQEPRG